MVKPKNVTVNSIKNARIYVCNLGVKIYLPSHLQLYNYIRLDITFCFILQLFKKYTFF